MITIKKLNDWFESLNTTDKSLVTFNIGVCLLGFVLGLCKLIFW